MALLSKKVVNIPKRQPTLNTFKAYLDTLSNNDINYFLSDKSHKPTLMNKINWIEFKNKLRTELKRRNK